MARTRRAAQPLLQQHVCRVELELGRAVPGMRVRQHALERQELFERFPARPVPVRILLDRAAGDEPVG